MSKYTPGPWIDNYFDDTQICINSGYELVAVVYSYDEKKEEGNANARLIAAAPDLLEICNKIYYNGEPIGKTIVVSSQHEAMLEAAIAKAEEAP